MNPALGILLELAAVIAIALFIIVVAGAIAVLVTNMFPPPEGEEE